MKPESHFNKKKRASLIHDLSGSRFGFWQKHHSDTTTKMSKPRRVFNKNVFWRGFVHMRTSETVYERRFCLICRDCIIFTIKQPCFHEDFIHENKSVYIIADGSNTEISLLRIQKVSMPSSSLSSPSSSSPSSSLVYVSALPDVLEIHCDAIPKILLFPSTKILEKFQKILSSLLVLISNHQIKQNKFGIIIQDDIIPSSSVLWRGWISMVKKKGNYYYDSKNNKFEKEIKFRRYVMLLDSQRFVVTISPPLFHASDHEMNIQTEEKQHSHIKQQHWFGQGGYFKIPHGTSEEEISLVKTNTVVCFDRFLEHESKYQDQKEEEKNDRTNDEIKLNETQNRGILRTSSHMNQRRQVMVNLSLPFGLQFTDRLIITEVEPNGQCANKGVNVGQSICSIENLVVNTKQELMNKMIELKRKVTQEVVLEVLETYLEKGSIHEFDAVMGAVGGSVVETSTLLRDSLNPTRFTNNEIKYQEVVIPTLQKKTIQFQKTNSKKSATFSQSFNNNLEKQQQLEKEPTIRIISKIKNKNKQTTVDENHEAETGEDDDDEDDEECFVIDIICEQPPTPTIAAQESSAELRSTMPSTLFKEHESKSFLSTAEMMRTGGHGQHIAKVATPENLKQAVIVVRKNGGCSWRKVPTLKDGSKFLLISAATGRAGLWQSATLRDEFQAAQSAVEAATAKLTKLPILTFPVIHIATRGRQLKRYLTINANCIQRTSLELNLVQNNLCNNHHDEDEEEEEEDVANENDFGNQYNEINATDLSKTRPKASSIFEKNNMDATINYFIYADKIIVNRTILFADLLHVSSFLAPKPHPAQLKKRTSSFGPLLVSSSSTRKSSLSTSTHSSSSSGSQKKSFLFKIIEDDPISHLNTNPHVQTSNEDQEDISEITSNKSRTKLFNNSILMPPPPPAPTSALQRARLALQTHHQSSRGRLRIEAIVADGKIATWYSGRARRGSSDILHMTDEGQINDSSSHGQQGVETQQKKKKNKNERSFVYEAADATTIEEQLQLRWKLYEMQSNLKDSNHTTAQYTSTSSSSISNDNPKTSFDIEMRNKHKEMVDFLYGPAIKIRNLNQQGGGGVGGGGGGHNSGDLSMVGGVNNITAPVLGAIESFVERVGANILSECPFFIEDFVQYLMDRFFPIMLAAGNKHDVSVHGTTSDEMNSASRQEGEVEYNGSSVPDSNERDPKATEAEHAFRLQLHRLVVDTLVVPILGERLWLSALDSNNKEDEAFSTGILLYNAKFNQVAFDKQQNKNTVENANDDLQNEEEIDVIRSLEKDRIINWDLAAKKLGALEHTMNPSDQLDVIKSAVNIVTNSPIRPPPSFSPSNDDMKLKDAPPKTPPKAPEPMSADELIPAFIKVVARAASKAAQRSEIGIIDSNSNTTTNAVLNGPKHNRATSFRGVESGGLLSPSSTVCYMRALLPNDLLVSEPGFILALLEGAVAYISNQASDTGNKTTDDDNFDEDGNETDDDRASFPKRNYSFRASESVRKTLERGLSLSWLVEADQIYSKESDQESEVLSLDQQKQLLREQEDEEYETGNGLTAPSMNLWGRSSSSLSTSSTTSPAQQTSSFDVWKNSALQHNYDTAYVEVDSGSSDEEGGDSHHNH